MHASCISSRPGISVSTVEGGGRGNLRRLTNFTPNFATRKWREMEAALMGEALIADMERETQLGL